MHVSISPAPLSGEPAWSGKLVTPSEIRDPESSDGYWANPYPTRRGPGRGECAGNIAERP
jgi:hypothetical protein